METNEDKILINFKHFFTPANMMDDDLYVHLIQRDTCLYDIQDLSAEDIDTRLQMKKKRQRNGECKELDGMRS